MRLCFQLSACGTSVPAPNAYTHTEGKKSSSKQVFYCVRRAGDHLGWLSARPRSHHEMMRALGEVCAYLRGGYPYQYSLVCIRGVLSQEPAATPHTGPTHRPAPWVCVQREHWHASTWAAKNWHKNCNSSQWKNCDAFGKKFCKSWNSFIVLLISILHKRFSKTVLQTFATLDFCLQNFLVKVGGFAKFVKI